jgi:ABC-type polysaccharide/polyol phosphate export permease
VVTARLAEPRRARVGSLRSELGDLFQSRELLGNLVSRDLKVRHRGTLLGMVWSLANPLLIVGLYYVVFKFILGALPATDLPRPDGAAVPFAIYFFCGLTLWNFFQGSLSGATTSVVGSAYLLRKVYFPRSILPLSAVLSSLVTFGFEVAVLFVAMVLFVGLPTVTILWAPVIVVVVGIMAFGFALLLSAATVFLRDVAHFIGVALQLMFWATPVVYSLQFLGPRPAMLRMVKLNPMTGAIVGFRNSVLLGHAPNFALLGYTLAFGVAMVGIGFVVFHRCQKLFPEIV